MDQFCYVGFFINVPLTFLRAFPSMQPYSRAGARGQIKQKNMCAERHMVSLLIIWTSGGDDVKVGDKRGF